MLQIVPPVIAGCLVWHSILLRLFLVNGWFFFFYSLVFYCHDPDIVILQMFWNLLFLYPALSCRSLRLSVWSSLRSRSACMPSWCPRSRSSSTMSSGDYCRVSVGTRAACRAGIHVQKGSSSLYVLNTVNHLYVLNTVQITCITGIFNIFNGTVNIVLLYHLPITFWRHRFSNILWNEMTAAILKSDLFIIYICDAEWKIL